jgi:hypothetical protein
MSAGADWLSRALAGLTANKPVSRTDLACLASNGPWRNGLYKEGARI